MHAEPPLPVFSSLSLADFCLSVQDRCALPKISHLSISAFTEERLMHPGVDEGVGVSLSEEPHIGTSQHYSIL